MGLGLQQFLIYLVVLNPMSAEGMAWRLGCEVYLLSYLMVQVHTTHPWGVIWVPLE
jgi:hypothetical protein